MRRFSTRGVLGLAGAAAVLVGAWHLLPPSKRPWWRHTPPSAAPTEFWEEEGEDEAIEHEAREAWIAERHRAGPGVDWRTVERTNGLAATARRASLAVAPPPDGAPDDGDRWTERGSVNQAGRTHVARWGTDGALYAGASMGGVWKRGPDDVWSPLGDALYGGVHWLEVLPAATAGDPDVLVAGTDGGLLHWSNDAGSSWHEAIGLDWAWTQRRLTVTHDGSKTLFAVRGRDTGYTAWRSTDAGAHWTQVYDFGMFAGDLWVSRTGAGPVWLAADGVLLRSDDLGDTWSTVGPLPDADSAELAASEAWTGADGAPRFWVVQNAHTLLRADDGGVTFTSVADLGDYWGGVTASTIDPEMLVYGGVEAHKSADGGATFTLQNAWSDYYDHEEIGRASCRERV